MGTRYLLGIALAFLSAAFAAHAAEAPVVVNSGTETVYAPPSTVEFTLIKEFKETDLRAAADKCAAFLLQAQEAFHGGDLQPLEVQSIPATVTSISDKTVRGGVLVRFSMSAFNAMGSGTAGFAGLCDKLSAVAAAINATLKAPVFKPGENNTAEESAVTRATENAYGAAEAMAVALKSSIYSVQEAEILELKWSETPVEAPGDVPQLACTVKVRLKYQLAPATGTV